MQKELEAPLRAAISVLEEIGCRYAVVGGIALSQWGVLRFMHDIDLKVVVPNSDYAALRGRLLAAFPERAPRHAPQNPLIVAVSVGEVIVDFLLALPGYDEQIVERASLRDWGSFSAWVCSAEDLTIFKRSSRGVRKIGRTWSPCCAPSAARWITGTLTNGWGNLLRRWSSRSC